MLTRRNLEKLRVSIHEANCAKNVLHVCESSHTMKQSFDHARNFMNERKINYRVGPVNQRSVILLVGDGGRLEFRVA